MRKLLFTCAALMSAALTYAQENALWMRNPAISPDGKTIAFGYKGDIYRVDVNGGIAVPLTVHEAHDMTPVWSHDGKYIAFASDRYGNFDVFVMPAAGGTPVRLTTNSAADYPYDFTPDNKRVLFGSGRSAPATSARFNQPRVFLSLYTVPVTGGRSVLLTAAGAEQARYNSKGDQLIFQDRKGLEDPFRKHHTSSVTRDIWVYDIGKDNYQQISAYNGEDREPVFGNGNDVYYLSEKGGISQNLFKSSLTDNSKMEQLTHFDKHPVRNLTRADNNILCFSYNGEVYTLKEGESPRKVGINVLNDGRSLTEKNVPVNGSITEFAISPNGKEVAFVARGEVFVSSVDGNMTKRITNTPQQERMLAWSPDGKKLIYAAERKGNWDIYESSIVRKEEPYFFGATVLKEEPVIATAAEEYQPVYAPDGKEIAYVEDRNILRVYNIASGKSRTLLPKGRNHSYADGDWEFSWSPDSKWLVTNDQQGYFLADNAAIVRADGKGDIIHPINGGFGESNTRWTANGNMLTWISTRNGRKPLATSGERESDIYAVFFDQATLDKFKLTKDEFNLLKEQPKDSSKTKDTASKPFNPDFKNLDDRQLRLTSNNATISGYVFNKDASKLYYMVSYDKGYDLWVTEPRLHDTKLLAKLGGSPNVELSKDENSLYVSNNGNIVKVDAASGKMTPVNIRSELKLNESAERAYILDHAWKQMKEKFYDPTLRNLDWKMYRDNYARFLPHISNNYDFQQLLSELLGELNASHTGGRYNPVRPEGDETASLGLLYDEKYTGDGLKVADVIAGGPLDKASSRVTRGSIIEKIDGEPVTAAIDYASLLNRKAGTNVLISVFNPDTKARWEEPVKPVKPIDETNLMYKRWVAMMRKMVDSLSNGKVAYVHVKAMDDASYRTVFDELKGRYRERQAAIIDTRFNGGGWLHDDLHNFFSGKNYLKFAPQGEQLKGGEPVVQYQGVSCLLMSEANYSDAHIFPVVYKQDNLGKLIGMPVPGTGTAVWWEEQIDPTLVFGIPMIANIDRKGVVMENTQLEPDIKVPLRYNEFLNGKDAQLEAAVKEMLKETK
nr:S41 family peptidase [Chitinophaga solisilvae]